MLSLIRQLQLARLGSVVRIRYDKEVTSYITPVLLVVATLKLSASEEGIPDTVNGHLSGDISRYFNSSGFSTCHDGSNFTYPVIERRCAKNEELFDGT